MSPHDDDHELELTLADGTVVTLELATTVRDLQATGHEIAVSPAGDIHVDPPVSEDVLAVLDTDYTGLAALLAADTDGVH